MPCVFPNMPNLVYTTFFFKSRNNYWSLLNHPMMANIWEKDVSILAENLRSDLSYLITIVTPLLTVCHILLLVCPLGENLTDKFWSSLLKPCHSGILFVCLNFLLFIYRILKTFTSQIRIDFENSKIRWPKTTTYKIMLCSSTNPKIFWVFRKCFELQ